MSTAACVATAPTSDLERAFSAVLRVRPQLCDATALDPATSCPTQTGDRVGDHSNQRVDDAELAANEAPASSRLRWPGTVPVAVAGVPFIYCAFAGSIVLVGWLWLTNVAPVIGAELNAEIGRL
jgi:hypothetical protein